MQLLEARAKVTNFYGVNVRRSPGLDRLVITVLELNQELTVLPQLQENADGHVWVGVNVPNASGTVVGWLVKKFVTILVDEPPKPVPSKRLHVGLHFAFSGGLGNSMEIIEQMCKDDCPPPAILVCSDPGLVRRIKEMDKRIITCYRWVGSDHDEFPMSGDEHSIPPNGAVWYDTLFKRHSQAVPYADLHQLHNEITFAGNTQSVEYAKRFNVFCMQMMMRATNDGQHVTFGNFMPGVPEQKHIDAMAESFTYAEANGHWLCYHPYTQDKPDDSSYFALGSDDKPSTPYFGLRPVEWVRPYPRLNVLGGEASYYNSPRNRGDVAFVKFMDEGQAMVEPYNTELRRWLLLLWTLRGLDDPNWKHDDLTNRMPLYASNGRKIYGR